MMSLDFSFDAPAQISAWRNATSGNVPIPVGSTYRGIGSDWFNQGNIAAEDWQRSEQSAQLAFQRDLAQMREGNAFTASQNQLNRDFNSSEAQKQRDFEERMASTQYQRAVEDMKKSGLNPILAYSNGGSSVPSGAAASYNSGSGSSSPSRSSSGHSSSRSSDPLSGVVSTVAHLVGKYMAGKMGFASDLALQNSRLDKELSNSLELLSNKELYNYTREKNKHELAREYRHKSYYY